MTTIAADTLQMGDGTTGHDGTLASQNIQNNGSLIYNRFGAATYSGTINGGGSVSVIGTGTQTLSGSSGYTGIVITVGNGSIARKF